MKRKAFKTSPSVRIPRAALDRLTTLADEHWADFINKRLHPEYEKRIAEWKGTAARLQASVSAAAHDNAIYVDALRDAVKLIDTMHQRAGKRPLPLLDGAEVKRLEEIRLLSLGI